MRVCEEVRNIAEAPAAPAAAAKIISMLSFPMINRTKAI